MLDGEVEIPFSQRIKFYPRRVPDGRFSPLSTLESYGGFLCDDYMDEPESISNIIDGLIDSIYLDELEKEADAWDALTHEQKYGTLEGAK
jgi:hypothetical protein